MKAKKENEEIFGKSLNRNLSHSGGRLRGRTTLFFIFILLFSCNYISDKEEIIDFVYEKSRIKLPEDFEVIKNELHGEFQTSDSDFSRDVHIKFSGKSKKSLINILSHDQSNGTWVSDGENFIFEGSNNGYVLMTFDTISGDFYIEFVEI